MSDFDGCALREMRDEELERLRAEVKDLKARLRAVRAWKDALDVDTEWSREVDKALDLRRKNWRKP